MIMNIYEENKGKFATSENGEKLLICGIGISYQNGVNKYIICINSKLSIKLYNINDSNLHFSDETDDKVLIVLKNNPENAVRLVNDYLSPSWLFTVTEIQI